MVRACGALVASRCGVIGVDSPFAQRASVLMVVLIVRR